MMGRQVGEAQIFYIFSVERHVPTDHLLRRVVTELRMPHQPHRSYGRNWVMAV